MKSTYIQSAFFQTIFLFLRYLYLLICLLIFFLFTYLLAYSSSYLLLLFLIIIINFFFAFYFFKSFTSLLKEKRSIYLTYSYNFSVCINQQGESFFFFSILIQKQGGDGGRFFLACFQLFFWTNRFWMNMERNRKIKFDQVFKLSSRKKNHELISKK